MRFWKDLKVKSKIMVLVFCGCAGLMVVGGTGVCKMYAMNRDGSQLMQGMQQIAQLQELKNSLLSMRLDLAYQLSVKDRSRQEEKAHDFAEHARFARQKLDLLAQSGLRREEKEQLALLRQEFDAYQAQGEKLTALTGAATQSTVASDADAMGRFEREALTPLYQKPAERLARMVEESTRNGVELHRAGEAGYRQAFLVVALVVAGIVVFALVCGTMIANSVSTPMRAVLVTLEEVSSGNLGIRSRIDSGDEMGLLANQVNRTAEGLGGIVTMMTDNSSRVTSAACTLHATSSGIACDSEEMALQAGSVAQASEALSATSNDIARSCHNAADDARLASLSANEGASIVGNTLQVMGRIAEQVRETARTVGQLGARGDQIGTIICTIEDIADQTNLLALNAAIEAARAGDQGRGFAVVADEVRALAQRTTTATREIGIMIAAIQQETKSAVTAMESGVQEVEQGTAEAARSGAALQTIQYQIDALNLQVNQIATAVEEQTLTTSEISNNIRQINAVVQRTALGAQGSAEAATTLTGLAEELQHLVRKFRL